MTEADVDRVESALDVKLPASYRHLLTHFPVRFQQGTCEGPLWDDPDKLIKRNQELRSARKSLGKAFAPIPPHYLFIGDDGGGWQHLLDVRSDPPVVCVMEFEDVKTIGPHKDKTGNPQTLNTWYHEYLQELRNDGANLDAATYSRGGLGWGCVVSLVLLCLIAGIVLSIAGIQWMLR
jgi:hypothetical protein